MSYMPKSKSDTHLTPDKVYEIIEGISQKTKDQLYDPCPANTPYKAPCFFNGLYGNWREWNFINPPYGDGKILKFVIKAIILASVYDTKTWMLLPSKTDQKFFHALRSYWPNIIWLKGRLKFKNNKHHATQPHFLVLVR